MACTMLVSLGAKKAPTDVVDMLLECHGRIRHFVGLAREVADAGGREPAQVAAAAGQVRRYFQEALPLHVADEEESLVPRLSGLDPALDEALAEMQSEHVAHLPGNVRLVELCAQIEADPSRLGELSAELGQLSLSLSHAFEAHLEAEEATVFPAVRARLSEGDRAAIAAELRARR